MDKIREPRPTKPSSWRGLAVTGTVGLFLSFAGAFGTGEAPFGLRTVYWLAMSLLGWPWGVFIGRRTLRWGPVARAPRWAQVAAMSVVIALPYSLVVALGTHLAFGNRLSIATVAAVALPVLAVTLVMVTLNVLLDHPGPVTEARAEPARFLERLPLKLKGAEVWAVEAEDHYLRLHTSKGQDLILLRLADAVAELEGIEGAQVHRSWWVARDAITQASRGDGRATLSLKDGAEVPVSRTYAKTLRERGWI